MTITIVDSSVEILHRLVEILENQQNVRSVETATSYSSALKLCLEHNPDILMLDMFLGEHHSLELLRNVKRTSIDTAVIMLYTREDRLLQMQCTVAGADYFCDLYHDHESLPGIISTIAISKRRNKNYQPLTERT